MKNNTNYKSKLVLFAATLIGLMSYNANAFDLDIDITEIKNTAGVIRIAIYDNEVAFKNADLSAAVVAVQLRADLHTFSIGGLPPGTYAIAAHHDEDKNRKLKKGLIFAIEGYSFSKGASCWSTPTFEDASFNLGNEKSNVVIRMKYCQ